MAPKRRDKTAAAAPVRDDQLARALDRALARAIAAAEAHSAVIAALDRAIAASTPPAKP